MGILFFESEIFPYDDRTMARNIHSDVSAILSNAVPRGSLCCLLTHYRVREGSSLGSLPNERLSLMPLFSKEGITPCGDVRPAV